MRRFFSLVASALVLMVSCISCARPSEFTVSVNGVSLLYAEAGPSAGAPVILLHGNGGSHHDLDRLTKQLARARYHVFAIDSRGQGANAPLPEYHYADMAEDVFQFCRKLGISAPYIYGWSDGGIIALEMEMMHPGTARAMAISGANITVDGVEFDAGGDFFEDTSNPLIAMMLCEPQIDPSELAVVKCPVLVLAGEHDLIKEEHTRLIASSLPNSKLMILEGEDHGSYIYNNPKIGYILLKELLDN